MSARRARVADWQAVAAIRALQRRAAEMEAMRVGGERAEAAERHTACEDALDAAQGGWAEALEGAFDPALARHWFAEVDRRQSEHRAAGEALGDADRRLGEARRGWHAAEARADIAEQGRRTAVSGAARRREEARLGENEDRAARKGREA